MKTTIDVPPDLWKDFTKKVIEAEGTRSNNKIIVELIRKWTEEKISLYQVR